jgi:hypothetical protein
MAERLTFDRSLYLPEAVQAAAAAYADHAAISVETAGEQSVAVISDAGGHDPRELADAFCNHVLHETIARRRQESA